MAISIPAVHQGTGPGGPADIFIAIRGMRIVYSVQPTSSCPCSDHWHKHGSLRLAKSLHAGTDATGLTDNLIYGMSACTESHSRTFKALINRDQLCPGGVSTVLRTRGYGNVEPSSTQADTFFLEHY